MKGNGVRKHDVQRTGMTKMESHGTEEFNELAQVWFSVGMQGPRGLAKHCDGFGRLPNAIQQCADR